MKLRISGPAKRDIAAILRWSSSQFGAEAGYRYERLVVGALTAVSAATAPIGCRQLPEVGPDVRIYHLRHSRCSPRGVRRPRHFVVHRREQDVIVVLRVLHDAMDLPSHVAGDE